MIRRLVAFAVVLVACSGGATSETAVPAVSSTGGAASTQPTITSTTTTTTATPGSTTTAQPSVWQRLARMRYPRSEMPAVVIGGQVYVPGGYMETAQGAAGQVFHEAYDPVTDQWSRLADMPESRHHHMAAAVDGALYVFGGFADAASSTTLGTNAWRYSPGSDTWEVLTDMPGPVAAGAAVAVGDSIFVVGGVPAGTAVYRYSVDSDRWEAMPALATAREHNAAAVVDGAVFAIGGRWGGETLTEVEVLEPGAAAWVPGPDMLEPRSGFGATVWQGDLVVGGGEDLQELRTSASVAALNGGTWTSLAPLPVPLHGFAFVTVDGALYSIGGSRRAGQVANGGETYVRER